MVTKEELDKIHKAVPSDYYQSGIKRNLLQRYWHTRRFNLISRELAALNLDAPVLDLGCHSGDLTAVVARASGQPVVGIDISEDAISYAQKRFPDIKFVQGDFPDDADFEENYFSAATSFDVMEHIPDTDRVVAEVARVLKPGGYFVIAIPNENLLFRVVWSLWTRLKGQVWDGVHVHDFRTEGFSLFEEAGFEKIKEKKIIGRMWWFVIFKLKN